MKTKNTAIASFCGLLITISIVGPSRLMAQASPGPMTPPDQSQSPSTRPAAPRPKPPVIQKRATLDGAWNLNHDQSDDPRTKTQPPKSTNRGNGGGYPGGGYPGGGYPRGPMGGGYPFPGSGGGGPYGGRGNGGQNQQYDEKMQQLVRRASSLNIALKNAEIDVTDDQSHKLVFYTDGRQLQKPKDDTYQEIAAHWSGSQLVSDEKSPQGAKMNRTFELSQDGQQLYETMHIDAAKSKPALYIQYVYDIPSAQASRETDPNQPVMKRRSDESNSAASPQGTQTGGASDPNQPVMKRRSDGSDDASTTQGTQASDSTSSSQGTQTSGGASSPQPPDPDQPVMKRRSDNSSPSQ